ncbi:MerR family DNA-binding transcriptional regulator [Streptomyces sp. NPDC057242]|uniref:MerR family DNA-binding transcriptional regulator n=1 Tax=unclassified Streptomyces TaxID=2593676 RepID=UPI00362A4BBF
MKVYRQPCDDLPRLTAGRALRRSGVPATTLRFHEDAALLTADRTPSGYRMYGEDRG